MHCLCLMCPVSLSSWPPAIFSEHHGIAARKPTANHKCESRVDCNFHWFLGLFCRLFIYYHPSRCPHGGTAGEKIVEVLGTSSEPQKSPMALQCQTSFPISVIKTCEFLNISIGIFLPGPLWNLHISPAPSKASWDPGPWFYW